MTDLNVFQQSALALLQRGFTPILVRRGEKKALQAKWQNTPRPTFEQAVALWSGSNPANIGVLTGDPSGIFVLDIDPGSGGDETLAALLAQHGPLPDTYTVRTGSGGRHFYFTMPDFPLRNTAGKIGPGVDTRGTGGYVVAAPSVSEKGPYTEVDPPKHVLAAPAWLLEILRPVPVAPVLAPVGPAATPEQASRYEAAIIEREVARLDALQRPWTDGAGWDHTTFEVACTLTQLANSGWAALDHNAVEALILDRAPQDDVWTADDVRAKITSARATVGGKDRPAPVSRPSVDVAGALASSDPLSPSYAAPGAPVAPPGASWARYSQDDYGNAKRLIRLHGERLRWVTDTETWAVFKDGRWQEVKTGGESLMADTIEATWDLEHHFYSDVPPPATGRTEPKSEREEFAKWLARQRSIRATVDGARTVKARGHLDVVNKDFDQHPYLLNVRNGVVDLLAGSIRPAEPGLLLKQQAPVDYVPGATAPTWLAFLEKAMPDPEMRNYLQRIIGYSITGSIEDHAFFLHQGPTGTGKSVFLNVMQGLLGDLAQTVPSQTFLSKKMEQHPADIARMEGKRMLQLSELPKGARLDEALIKRLSGGDTITARGMGQEFREFKMTGKAHVVTNFLPHLGSDAATERRLHLIGWKVQPRPDEVDRTLAERIIATEMSGVLNWAIEGTQEWRRHRLAEPVQAQIDKAEYLAEEDLIATWLAERTDPSTTSTPFTMVYESYRLWCMEMGLSPMVGLTFGKELTSRGIAAKPTTKGQKGRLLSIKAPVPSVNGW